MNIEPFCIGICGQKQSGKDETATILVPMISRYMNKTFVKAAFADAVKDMLCTFHYLNEKTRKPMRVTKDFIEKNKNNDYIPIGWECNVRNALCNIGDRFREINPEVWTDIVLLNNKKNKIISDVRYPNEAFKIFNNKKGLVIKIIRPGFEKIEGHRSEISMLKIDKYLNGNYCDGPLNDIKMPYNYLIINNGSIEDLKEKIQSKLIVFILDKWKYLQ